MKRRNFIIFGALAGVASLAAFLRPSSNGVGLQQLAAAEPLNATGLPNVERPVVVELFTSQGCNTCPPADALAGELAKLPGVLPLSLHVDYWDYIGWKDPFALPENTPRQRGYANALDARFIYTPQMMIDGIYDAAGHRQRLVYGAIDRAAQNLPAVAMELDPVKGVVRIPAGEAPREGATVWQVVYDKQHNSDITRGENSGKTLSYYNVVREFNEIGQWTGEAMEIALNLDHNSENDACAILLQTGRNGRMLGVVTMALR